MAPISSRKRNRAQADNQDAINGDVRPGKKARRKQRRPSFSEASDDEYTSESPSNHSRNNSGSDLEEDAEDANYFRATQVVIGDQMRDSDRRPNLPAEQGIIEEVRCTNFMCHEQLTVTLGPLINFIIGHNGSGKSAVLTALTLCLGGKATATNRGQNLKSFIKEGKDYCILSVKIKNQGSAAYRPDLYGRSIIVERHFNRNGTSGFKLKDMNGKIISTKKPHLEDIIDAFALQIDNPMNVLTQDMSREFLNHSTPKDKYKFFLKGTQLETLSQDYVLISNNLDNMESKTQLIKQDIETLQKRAEAAVAKARRAENLTEMRRKERDIAAQMAWAQVREQEALLDECEHTIQSNNREIANAQAKVDAESERYEQANQDYLEAEQAHQDRESELIPVNERVAEVKDRFQEVKQKLLKIKTEERTLVSRIMGKQKEIQEYEGQIAECRRRQAEADNGQHAQKVQELEVAKQAREVAKTAFDTHTNSIHELREALKAAQQSKLRTDQLLQSKRDEILRTQEKISDAEMGQRHWVDSYANANLSKLMKAIDGEHRFRERPIGPMGRHVKLLNQDWSSILEKQAGASLSAFVVTSKADQVLLSALMRKTGCIKGHSVIIGNGRPIDTTGNEPDADLETWMRILKFDNDLVRNQMIVNHSIEQTVLFKSRKEGENFMHDGGARRRNVRMCFTQSDHNPRKGHVISVNPQSNAVSIGPIAEWQNHGRMQADKEEQLRTERQDLDRLQRELRDLTPKVQDADKQVEECQRAIQGHKRQMQNLKVKWQKKQEDAESLESELEAAAPDDGRIAVLENNLEEARNDLKLDEGQYEDTVIGKDALNDESRDCKSRLEAAQAQQAELHTKIGKASVRKEKLKGSREDALKEKNETIGRVKIYENNKADWELTRGERQADVERITAEAEMVARIRVDVPEGQTYEDLGKKLKRMVREREDSERELGGSEGDLLDKANAAKRDHKKARDGLREMDHVAETLKRSLINRQQRWHRFRQEISMRARITFTYLLSERQFRGKLQVDHHSKQLDIQIQPDITVAHDAGRQTKTLSGGEKSFSTICLLLALWDAMGSPIRCMDEFDVFMDNVNRASSMKMIIGAARRAVGRQYILITPQAMDSVKDKGDVKIIRMRDPERGQTALSFNNGRGSA